MTLRALCVCLPACLWILPFCALAARGQSNTVTVATDVRHADEAAYLAGPYVYPESVLELEDAGGWGFYGAVGGHRGGVRRVPAPGRPGHAIELWMQLNKENPAAPQWVFWQRPLDPWLVIDGVQRIEVDVMALDPVPFRITARFGSGDGLGVIPATWSPLGVVTTGAWQTVSIPVRPVRPSIDTLRFDLRVRQDGVPHDRPVRLLIDRMRFVPRPDPLTTLAVAALRTAPPAGPACLVLHSPLQRAGGDPVCFTVELQVGEAAACELQLTFTAGRKTREAREAVRLHPPYTRIDVTAEGLLEAVGGGTVDMAVRIREAGGAVLAETGQPLSLRLYDRGGLTRARRRLLRRMHDLEAVRDERIARGNAPHLADAGLAVARLFLQDNGFIEDDFDRQRAYTKAFENLDQVAAILDRAQRELAEAESVPAVTETVRSYRPDRPVRLEGGAIRQDGHPLLLVGGIGWSERVRPHDARITARLGFNAASIQACLKDWFDDSAAAEAGRAETERFLAETRQAGMAANLLLSGHYPPDPLPDAYAAARDAYTGSSMLPWNILSPATTQLYADWYERVLPILEGQVHVINVETANEPNHVAGPEAPGYSKRFAEWLETRYGTPAALNAAWGTQYTAFGAIRPSDVEDAGGAAGTAGALYDWHRFRSDVETRFFAGLKDRIRTVYPDLSVTLKLMGHPEHFGYAMLNEQSVVPRAQTQIGTDGSDRMWLDYLKSLKPGAAVINAEWHILQGPGTVRNPGLIQRRMLEGAAHGIAFGAIWNWRRKDWASLSNGAEQSMTRYAMTLDAVAQGAWKIRAAAEPLSRFANLDGGRCRILYDLNTHLRRGSAYMDDLQAVYERLARNARGVRFVMAGRLSAETLAGADFVAGGAADALTADEMTCLAEWVRRGGTLWLTRPALQHDPYGRAHRSAGLDMRRCAGRQGQHDLGAGAVTVGPHPPTLAAFLDGPFAAGPDGAPAEAIEVRLAENGGVRWVYLANRGDAAARVLLRDWPGGRPESGTDLLTRRPVDWNRVLELDAQEVLIVR
ncbi:MAG: beta-galactosidase, partial [Lentisphaerae bacterium]|nr:beta-galactosidase [Lentisphaerota bacterium]